MHDMIHRVPTIISDAIFIMSGLMFMLPIVRGSCSGRVGGTTSPYLLGSITVQASEVQSVGNVFSTPL